LEPDPNYRNYRNYRKNGMADAASATSSLGMHPKKGALILCAI